MMGILIVISALGALAVQDKPAPKTVEDRLRELEEKLSALEKRNKALEEENQALEKRLADSKAAKDAWAKETASAWVKRCAKAVPLSEAQSAELGELWRGWQRSDLDQAPTPAAWKAREEAIRSKLTPDQVPKLARAARDDQEALAKVWIAGWVQSAKLAPDHGAAFEKAVLARVALPEEVLVVEAHPKAQVGWAQITGAVEGCLPDLASVLSDEERARLQDLLSKWKFRR
jgi:hypothetical protein